MHIDERCLCPTRCLQIQRRVNAAVLSGWTRYTALQIARKHGRSCARVVRTHAYKRDRLATLQMRALRTRSLSLSLSLSRTRAHTFSLLRFFLSFSPLPLRAFVRLDASAACFSKLVRDTAESHKERFFRFRVRLRGAEFPWTWRQITIYLPSPDNCSAGNGESRHFYRQLEATNGIAGTKNLGNEDEHWRIFTMLY